MLEKFVPDMYTKSIYTINYESLKKKKIKCLLFDLDNTLVPVNIDKPTDKVKNLFVDLKEMGFHIIIISNSPKSRLEPFKDILEVDVAAMAMKPKKDKYLKIMEMFNYKPKDIVAIGDQLFTDMWGANKLGITTILVNPMSKTEAVTTKFNRKLEKVVEKMLIRKDLFVRGKYYE